MVKHLAAFWIVITLMSRSLIACEDPCPNIKLGREFENEGLKHWKLAQRSAPQWRGVSSYHWSDSVAHFIAFVANSNSVIVGEGDCALSKPSWVSLDWEDVTDEEFETISTLETYYESLPPIVELKKAKYGDHSTLYLLKTELKGSIDWIFKLYSSPNSAKDRALKLVGGAYAYPISFSDFKDT